MSLPEPGAAQPTEGERSLLLRLAAKDRQVRAHQAAHQAVGGLTIGGTAFTFVQGPDRKTYVAGGDVSIGLRVGRTPAQTIVNARRTREAALASTDPSSQDLAVASQASLLEAKAMVDQRVQARASHVHSGTPCLACSRDAARYSGAAQAAAPRAI